MRKTSTTTLLLGLAAAGLTQLAVAGAPPESISVAELEARHAQRFAAADGNGDGLVDAEEFAALERPHHAAGPRGRAPRGPHGAPAELERALFAELDGNADGALTREEFSLDALRDARRRLMKAELFARLDSNQDGYLDPAEFPPPRLLSLDSDGDGELTREELRDGAHRHRRDG